jgi:hypothetical protein
MHLNTCQDNIPDLLGRFTHAPLRFSAQLGEYAISLETNDEQWQWMLSAASPTEAYDLHCVLIADKTLPDSVDAVYSSTDSERTSVLPDGSQICFDPKHRFLFSFYKPSAAREVLHILLSWLPLLERSER